MANEEIIPLSFKTMTQEEESKFFSSLREWEGLIKDKYLQLPLIKGEAQLPLGLNVGTMLRKLPRGEREALFNDPTGRGLRKLIQWQTAWDTQAAAGEIPEHMSTLMEREGSHAFRFHVDPTQLSGPGTNPLAVLYASLFPNLNTSNKAAGLKLGMNIPTADFLQNWTEQLRNDVKVAPGKKVFVFDVETSGLYEESGVRQVAGRTIKMGGPSKFEMQGDMLNEYFDTSALHLGFLHDPAGGGETIPMSNWIQRNMVQPGKDVAKMGYGQDFADKMTPFLKQMLEADYIAGHNLNFDIGQVFRGMQATTAYHKNLGGFADLLDQASDKFLAKGAALDTAWMARSNLSKITTHELLQQRGVGTLHSLENLMLQTNLYDLLKTDIGEAPLHKALGVTGGQMMHAAETDVDIEAYLFTYLHDDKLKLRKGELPVDIQRAIVRSYAPTPITKIANPAHIHPELLEELRRTGGVTPLTNADGIVVGHHYNITPVEQEIWSTRRLGERIAVDDPGNHLLLQGLGDWHRYTKQGVPYSGWLNRDASLFRRGEAPSAESFVELQDKLAAKGIPFADISRPERWLSVTLAQAGAHDTHLAKLMGSEGRSLMDIGSNLGISQFSDISRAYITQGVGKNISLPTSVIKAAEDAEVLSSNLSGHAGKELQTLGLSQFRTNEGVARTHLVYKFEEGEASALADWLANKDLDEGFIESTDGLLSLRDVGFTPKNLKEITEQLPLSGVQHGIGVGFLQGESSEMVANSLDTMHGGGYRDADAIPFRAGVINTDGGVIEMGAFVEDRFGDPVARKVGYKADLKLATEARDRLKGIVKETAGAASARAYYYAPEITHSTIEKILGGFDTVRSHSRLVGGVALAGAGLWAWHRHKEKTEAGNEVLEQMPTESPDDYYNYRRELNLQPAPARRRQDPLLTAGVVGNMDRSRVNHMLMGTQKYNNLYSGAL